jgi:sugar phosphate isomerase/epimerase
MSYPPCYLKTKKLKNYERKPRPESPNHLLFNSPLRFLLPAGVSGVSGLLALCPSPDLRPKTRNSPKPLTRHSSEFESIRLNSTSLLTPPSPMNAQPQTLNLATAIEPAVSPSHGKSHLTNVRGDAFSPFSEFRSWSLASNPVKASQAQSNQKPRGPPCATLDSSLSRAEIFPFAPALGAYLWRDLSTSMKTNRREFLKTAGLAVGTASVFSRGLAAESTASPTFITRPSNMKLGIVTYNIAKDWDVPTIIKNCAEAKFQGAELRTSHAHGVEVALNKEQREKVKKQFRDSPVELMGLGSAFDYHTPDQAKLRADIAATKEYILLAHDVGAPGVKVRPNGLPPEVPKEKTLEQIGKSLRELGEFAAGHGVQIRLEVHGKESALVPNIKTIMGAADHKNVGVCWNSNQTDLDGAGFEHNFNLLKKKIFTVHMRDLYLDEYPFRKLLAGLNESGFSGYCLAEISESKDPVRVLKYFRSLWLAYQNLL